MKSFEFRLKSIKKLREFEEYQQKFQLGVINGEIQRIDHELSVLDQSIKKYFSIQEEELTQSIKAKNIKIYADVILGIKLKVRDLLIERKKWQKDYDKKMKELIQVRNKVKVLEKMEDKEKSLYKKEFYKKISDEVEDIYSMNKYYVKDEINE